MADWITATLGVVAGGLLSIFGGWLSNHQQARRERDRRREERSERLTDRSNDLQRETLLALQVASQKLLRNAGASLHQDIVAFKSTGTWQRQLLPEALSDDGLHLITEVILRSSRIRDAEVRKLADELRRLTNEAGSAPDESRATAMIATAASVQAQLLERTGKLLREMDEAPR